MPRLSTIELFKEDMKFSAGHFTVFSATVRENLHGHNYNLYAAFTTEIEDVGLSFDYRLYKEKFTRFCDMLDEKVLIAQHCKFLNITENEDYYHIMFNNEKIILLKRDVLLLPITNVTVEELSNWFLQQVLADEKELVDNKIKDIIIKVYSGPGQSGSASWKSATEISHHSKPLEVVNV